MIQYSGEKPNRVFAQELFHPKPATEKPAPNAMRCRFGFHRDTPWKVTLEPAAHGQTLATQERHCCDCQRIQRRPVED